MKLSLTILLVLMLKYTADAKAEDFSYWSLNCDTIQCSISQMLIVKNSDKMGVVGGLTLSSLPNKQTLLTIRTSSVTDIKRGLAIKVDNHQDIKLPVAQCISAACETHVILDKKLLNEMKVGKVLGVFFFNKKTNKQVSLPFSLKGFSPAYLALQKSNPGSS